MRTFADKTGRMWSIDLTVGACTRVRANTEINLFAPDKDDLLGRLNTDFGLFWEVLWSLVEPQAVQLQVNAEQFGEAMASNCLVTAQAAFMEEWRDFFTGLAKPHLAKAVEQTILNNKAALKMVEEVLARETAGLETRVQAKMQSMLNDSSTKLRELLDSTLGPSPTDK